MILILKKSTATKNTDLSILNFRIKIKDNNKSEPYFLLIKGSL